VTPTATGVRRAWPEIPAALRARVEDLLGSGVAEAVTQPGGFSPGVAARLRCADGRRAFVKAVSAESNPESPAIHRAEAAIAAVLPASAPAPRLLGSFDEDGWVVLVFEDVAGRMPAQPWDPGELRRVLAALADLPAALDPAPAGAPSAADRLAGPFTGWRSIAASGDVTGLDPWAVRNLGELVALESRWPESVAGTALVHSDLRADNLLLTEDRVVVVDWPWACVAAPWLDLVLLLPSVRMQGGPPAHTLFEPHPLARAAAPDAVTSVLAAFTGFLVHSSRLPAPPGLPTLRPFQRAQGRAALEWLRHRTGLRGTS
jgi:aminoglycoside phosphotransferase (APT) family kinase protein